MSVKPIKPGDKVVLADIDPDDEGEWKGKKEEGKAEFTRLCKQLDELQEILYAEHKHKVLIVIQALDTAGKDGTIRSVFEGVNPQGVKVASFKAPSQEEKDHDYLWRVHARMPASGEMVLFNRSHYEDVLVVRVHQLVPEDVWKRRYDQINNFERMLAEEGTTIRKIFLHISKDEQKARLQDRIDTPRKQWKFNPADLKERELWSDYMKAYEEALSRTSKKWAPWYVIPSNHNWYRNLCVAQIIVETLKGLKLAYPKPQVDVNQIKIE